jgi:hypothetical protein
MKARASILVFLGIVLALVALMPTVALAQSDESQPPAWLIGIVVLCGVVFGVGGYIYGALALQTIAKKTNTSDAWWAWIPILHAILMLNIAKKPLWWFFLFLIPFVNIVILIIVWMAIAEARGKPNWWGIMLIVPVMGIIMPGYLAWSD